MLFYGVTLACCFLITSNGVTFSTGYLSKIIYSVLTLLELAVNGDLTLGITMDSNVKTIVFENFLPTFKCDVIIDDLFWL